MRQDLLDLDPFSAAPAVPPDVRQFADLTGVDVPTATRHVDAAKRRGEGLESALDAFFAQGEVSSAPVRGVTDDEMAARRLEEDERRLSGRHSSLDEVVGKLKEMGFETSLCLAAAERCGDLAAATQYCLTGGADAPPQVATATYGASTAPIATAVVGRPTVVSRPRANPAQRSVAREYDAAARAHKAGKLYKLSRASSLRGARWQRRSFVLRNCELGYAEDAAPHEAALSQAPLKGVSVWGCYALREPAHQGKAHVFAVYSTAAQASAQPSSAPRTTLAMLAADDAQTAADWCRALYAAAGRAGMLLRVGEDSDAATLLCVCCADAPDVSRNLRAGGDNGRVVVSRVGGALERVGLRVDDELTALDGQPIPYLDADRLGRLLATARRPFELTVRRPRAPRRRGGPRGTTPPVAPAPPARPVVDLLGLDLPAPAAPVPAAPAPLSVPPPTPATDAPVVAAVRAALDNRATGQRCAARGDTASATAAYRCVVDDLLRAQPLYAASPANQAAVAAALPGVDLAALYDEAVDAVRAGERPAPAPVTPARAPMPSLASLSRAGHDPFADVELPAPAPAPVPPPVPPPVPVAPAAPLVPAARAAPVPAAPAWAPPPAPAPPVPARAPMPLPTPAVPAQPKAAPWPAAAALAAPRPPPRPVAVPLPAVPAQPTPPPRPEPVAATKPKPPPPSKPKPKPPPPPPPRPAEPVSWPARVTHPYDAAEPWQLSAAEGDMVNILETAEDGWADVVRAADGARGMLPVSYLAAEGP